MGVIIYTLSGILFQIPIRGAALAVSGRQCPQPDLVGKLDVVLVACTKCDRAGRYPVAKRVASQRP